MQDRISGILRKRWADILANAFDMACKIGEKAVAVHGMMEYAKGFGVD